MLRDQKNQLNIIGVASPYAWDVVESATRNNLDFCCIDNYGGADSGLPNLRVLNVENDRLFPFTVGLSSAVDRGAAYLSLFDFGFTNVETLIDPTAVIASTAIIGHGVYVNAGTVISSHVKVECAVNINRSASIGHHSEIGWGASIGPGVTTGGHVTVGQNTLIGVGAVILPKITVGMYCTIGAGAVVTKNVPDGMVVAGNPARQITSQRTTSLQRKIVKCPFC